MGNKLTSGRIAALVCSDEGKPTFLWDTEVKGLGVKVSPGGSKQYVFESRLHGKTLRLTIGDVRTWPLDGPAGKSGTARSEARRLSALIDQGIDPRKQAAEKQAEDAAAAALAKRKTARVADAWDAYIEHQKDKMKRPHIERGKKWGERHLLDHERLAQAGGEKRKRGEGMTKSGPLYPLLQLRMGEVSTNTLKDWMRDEAETRANNARQAFEMFRAFWRWCASRDEYRAIIDTEAVESKELRDEVPSRKSKRFDVMGREHLPAWFSAVHSLSNPVISAYLQILLLTGARREELAELRWQDVDFKWGNLWVKDKVMEEGRKIPLTPYVSFLLSNLKRINETPPLPYRILNGKRIENDRVDDKPSPWVFFSRAAADGRITEPRIPHNRALAVAGLPPLSIHGLRRTFKSLSEWVEMPVGIVAQIMGHKPSATAEKHYTERPLDLLKIWHSKYEAWILEQAGIQQSVESAQGLRVVGRD
jgi:integrase